MAPPRALWTGTISFGLVNVPVRMYSAVQEHKLHFNYLHTKDDSPIGYEKYCKKEDKPVPDDEIAKAFEVSKGKYVYLDDEDFAAAKVEGYRTIELTDFVPYEEIDPIYFEKTYYLGPQEGGEKVYALLAKAMDNSGLAGIGTFVMRDRENLGCIRIRDGVLTLEKLYFADEIRPAKGIKPKKVSVSKQEREMAEQLIDRFSGSFRPEKYKDTYTEALMKVVKAKQRGKEVEVAPERKEPEVPDLMEALRASLETSKRSRGRSKRKTTSRRRPARKAA
jgi:DNA end-binding protein Ku